MGGLERRRQPEQHHRGGDRDLKGDETNDPPRCTRSHAQRPPPDVAEQRVGEQPVDPMDVLQVVPAGTTWPLQSGNPRQALAAPRFAVSAPRRRVTKPSVRAVSPAREGGALGRPRAATINVASSSIAVPRWRITVHGGRLSFTVTAPSRTAYVALGLLVVQVQRDVGGPVG